MTDKNATLLKLNQNLNTLREREARYGGNPPLELLNQIADHRQAINLTRQAITGEISDQVWEEALKPLLLAIQHGQVVTIEADTYIAGNVGGNVVAGDEVGGDKVLGNKITVTYEALPPPPVEARTRADLGILLKNVETTWIKDVLEHSVHQATLLDLGMESRANAVDHPWQMVLEAPDQSPQVLPPGTKIKDIFEAANRLLLILGEPGSGKTTTMLQLARDLIATVDTAFNQPIPVIFNLSTWTDKQQPLADWLVAELNSKYRTPKKLGRYWLEERRILPLLDGLDEVKPENRAACVERINRLAVDYGLYGLVVCSRIKDYMALGVRLQFNRAIYLQPLSVEQLDEYFELVGDRLKDLRLALQQDRTLQGLAQSPLMLNIMSLAYQNISTEALIATKLKTDEARRRHLFDTYIARMFKRRGDRWPYDPEQTKKRLSWLAQNMQMHNEEVFLIERLQPSWLQLPHWCWTYTLVSRLICGLAGGIIIALTFGSYNWLIKGPNLSPMFWLIVALIFSLCFGLLLGFVDLLRFKYLDNWEAIKKIPTNWWPTVNIIFVALITGLIGGPSLWLLIKLLSGFSVRLSFGLVMGLLWGLIFGIRGSRQSLKNDIQVVEALRWFWRKALKSAAIAGPTIGLGLGFIAGMNDGLSDGLTGGVIGGLIGASFYGLRREIIETETFSNQGIQLSKRNSILGGLTMALIGVLSDILIFSLSDMLVQEQTLSLGFRLAEGLILGFFAGLLGALWYGGLDLIQHYTLRFTLLIQGNIPLNYGRFLDHTTDYLFLQKVGGGYRFIHRLLLDHFAELSTAGKRESSDEG